jgi:hypothetical protein
MVTFAGSDGVQRQTMVFKFGDTLLWDKRNGESYVTQNLEVVPERLAVPILQRYEVMAQESSPPAQADDAVDVMGNGEATPDPTDTSTRGRITSAVASGRPGLTTPPPGDPRPAGRPLVAGAANARRG